MKQDKKEQMFVSSRVPILQNKVYCDEVAAQNAHFGSLNIVLDKKNGLFFNKNFDENLMEYDQDYDNSVPSKVFMDYYDEIGDYIVEKYDLKNGVILDIGCGKGTFLSRLAKRYDFIQAIGIDPSYEGPLTTCDGRLKFKKEYFNKEHLNDISQISLVLSRHVLEHIPSPSDFLKTIFEPLENMKDIPLFIEVPDLTWIIKNKAFWDFCYEHVNYFTHESLSYCIKQAGANITKISPSFKDQYIWIEATLNSIDSQATLSTNTNIIKQVFTGKKDDFKEYMDEVVKAMKSISLSKEIVIWGMATKGVLYSLHLMNLGIDVSHCVDINENKQGKYSPLSGLKIQSPSDLTVEKSYAIVCMNPNYAKEIELNCLELGLDVLLLNPSGEIII